MSDQNVKLLHIDSSIMQEASVSRKLSSEVVTEWLKANPATSVEHLDLAVDAPNHFNADALGIRGVEQAEQSESQR